MKQILIVPILLLMSVMSYAQQDTSKVYAYYPANRSGFILEEGYLPYVVGSYGLPGYDIEIRTCPADGVTLSNGRKIAGLSCILLESSDYVGGQLIFGKDTTTIKSVTITPDGDNAVFVVNGKKFSMSFTLSTGVILKLEDTHTVFNTEGKGIWSIVKKEA